MNMKGNLIGFSFNKKTKELVKYENEYERISDFDLCCLYYYSIYAN